MSAKRDAARIEKVSIRPGVSVLSILRHLNYKPWFALAEFVDNSLQSYLEDRSSLEALHGPSFRLTVQIEIDSTPPLRISVRDNAAGISHVNFPRAFRPAAIPPNRTGLSEFGMGMKSAACWFAPKWEVRTKALGDTVERTVKFDVERIVRDQLEELVIEESPGDPNAHFTEVQLYDLHHTPVGRTLGKIKDHLTDIYRVYVREDLLKLKFDGELLTYQEPPILQAPYVREPGGEARAWRKDISFDFGDGLRVKGFAGLMDPMNTKRSGLALFRRKRLIEGSGDEGYRPALVFGQAGNHRWRRLFGELHLEGFEVSHTKDGFRWDENEQPFLELLREHLDSPDLPMLRQADNFRVQAARSEVMEVMQQAANRIVEAMREPLPTVLEIVADEPPVQTRTVPLEPVTALVSKQFAFTFRDEPWQIRIDFTNDPAQSDWLSISDQAATNSLPQLLEIRISTAHPFMVNFAQFDPEQVEAVVRIAAALALAEKLARRSGVGFAGTIRRNVNEILREALSQP
jgi:hypothetical protein